MQQQPVNASPAATGATGTATAATSHVNGGRFDFDDGGTYCGGWEDGKAHGHGVCTGPKGQGAYSGSWHFGFEVSGVYTWPSGSAFEGQWQNGKRHGLGVESRGRWLYRGEWTQGFKGRYGVRQSSTSNAKYEGTWANGLQDGYGSETYADGGTYQGQWLRGMRHGYGVRNSAPFGLASHYRPNKSLRASLTSLRSEGGAGLPAGAEAAAERDRRVDDSRGGFVLKARSDEPPARRRSLVEKSTNIKKSILSGLKIRKQRSTGDLEKRGTSGGSIRSTGSSTSWVSTESSHSGITSASMHTDSNASFVVEDEHLDGSVTETYMGEWKNDKRSGFGISERSDGLRYEGEWFNNKKYGYGVTTFRDGSKEEGKYKNNVLITSQKKKHLFLIRSAKFRERIDAAVNAAQRASKIALQKADIAISRTATARGKAELADIAADQAREDYELALATAKQFAPDFSQPGLEKLRNREIPKFRPPPEDAMPGKSILHKTTASEGSVPNTPTLTVPNQMPHVQMPSYDNTSQHMKSQHPQSIPSQQYPSQSQQSSIQQQQQYQAQQPYQSQQQYQQQHSQYSSPQFQQQQSVQQQYPYPQQSQTQQYQQQPSSGSIDQQSWSQQSTDQRLSEDLSSASQQNKAGLRRNSKLVSGDNPAYNFQQAMSDHFDHYKRPPSRDSSVDRYSRAASRLGGGGGSRQPSVDKTSLSGDAPADRGMRAPSLPRGTTPVPATGAGNGAAIGAGMSVAPPPVSQPPPPFEEVIIRKRGLGQDIVPSPQGQPKRTESLYISPSAKPPAVKDWFSRQQLVMLVLFVNISLAIMFFKLLT
ncbi:junctophilin-1 isoform X2 [Nilaparvata lugens]|uniref:junctophilin-1 isoform X2 n=1 Tax=Nilaparvata lugens TaxID=108931 RepID=UPI00193C94BE|nr:junctophilin-1 isoform X2 [Nilaparvata lugens]